MHRLILMIICFSLSACSQEKKSNQDQVNAEILKHLQVDHAEAEAIKKARQERLNGGASWEAK